jgi:hypothetical protein
MVKRDAPLGILIPAFLLIDYPTHRHAHAADNDFICLFWFAARRYIENYYCCGHPNIILASRFDILYKYNI